MNILRRLNGPANWVRLTLGATALLLAVAIAPVGSAEDKPATPAAPAAPATPAAPAAAPAAPAPEVNVQTIEEVLQALAQIGDEPVWAAGEKLAQLGDKDRPRLIAALEGASPEATLALGQALLRLGEQKPATEALEKLLLTAEAPLARRQDAAALLGTFGGELAAARLRQLMNRADLPELLQVEAAKAAWKLTHGGQAYDKLSQLMEHASSLRARDEAVLALGRFGRFAEVKPKLEALGEQPGRIGDEARTLLMLNEQVDNAVSRDTFPSRLVSEVVKQIREKYAPDESNPEEKKLLDSESLATEAARAVLNSIDPYSDYLDRESYREMLEQIDASYGGIGAWVGMRDGRFTILTPMYGQPAFKAGLQSLDVVEKIDGKEIRDFKLKDIINMLKGPAKTKVAVTVWRRGWTKSRDFEVVRDVIKIPAVVSQELPGGVGYVRLTSFNDVSAADVRKAIEGFKGHGDQGVIFDLTNNPGGLLSAAVQVGSLFLGEGKRIVYSEGKPDVYRRQDYHAPAGEPFYTGPLVVMVNEGSASASEIVAGALRDHKRAKLVGRKTFGKGSVQQLIPVLATRGQTRIKLTIAKYYLPGGSCIHKKGIDPDVEVKEEEIPLGEVEARLAMRDNRDLDNWLVQNYTAHEQEFRALLDFDEYNPEKYPGFDALFEKLVAKYPKHNLTKDMVRRELRQALRRHMMNLLGEEIPVDLEENATLQRALVTLGESLKGGLPDLPVYRTIREKLAEAEKLAAKRQETEAPGAPAAGPTAPAPAGAGYREALDFLAGFVNYERTGDYRPGRGNLGTERMEELLRRLGEPQRGLPVVHVAGSKGKGTVSYLTARLLAERGYKVGLYTSPHLQDVRERIVIGARPIAPERFAELFARLRPVAEAMRDSGPGRAPTYFELLTALAFLAFKAEDCTAAVLEVGLGGRLDATNVANLNVMVSGVTSISLDHLEQLGPDLLSIAAEKAGIFRPGVPAVVGETERSVVVFLRRRAATLGCPAYFLGSRLRAERLEAPLADAPEAPQRLRLTTWNGICDDISLPLLGAHQARNAAVALGLAELFFERVGEPLPGAATVRRAWRNAAMPGRLEVVDRSPWVVLDGAHNQASIWALTETLPERFTTPDRCFVFAVAKDKQVEAMLRLLKPFAAAMVFTAFDSPRCRDPQELERIWRQEAPASPAQVEVHPEPATALRRAIGLAGSHGLVCVTGSLYLVGTVRGFYRSQ